MSRSAAIALQARGWVLLLALASAGSAALALLLPAVLARAVDTTLHGTGSGDLLLLTALAGALLLAETGAELAESYALASSTRQLRNRLVDRILALGLSAESVYPTGDLAARVIGVAPQAARTGTLAVRALTGLVQAGAALLLLWRIDPLLPATIAVALPIGFALLRVFARDSSRLVNQYQSTQSRLAGGLMDALTGIRTIRAAGTVEQEVQRILTPLPALSTAGQELWHGQGRLAGRTAALVPLTLVAVLLVAGPALAGGRISAGQFLAAAAYTPLALGLLAQVSLWMSVVRLRVSLARLDQMLTEPAVPVPGEHRLPPGPGHLVLRDVSVRTHGEERLREVSLTLSAGSSTALVGRSGAGKTTLARVAGGLLPVRTGTVRLDGRSLAEVRPQDLAREITYAFEVPALLGTSVADAIGYGLHPGPAPERVFRAAEAARASSFVHRLPAGFATGLDQAPLSGGERQRLGLARAFVRRARLLILDDATSSLDTVTEAEISAALAGAGGCTRLVVAHRPATADAADQVAWLDSGRVRAVGTHRQLWHDPEYRQVFSPVEDEPTGPPR